MKVKVCGLKFPDNISKVAALKPDMMGFICYDRSPRFVCGMDETDLNGVGDDIIRTGVFVNSPVEEVNTYITQYQFKAVQFHGSESPQCCAEFLGRVKVVKAFGIDEKFDFADLVPYYGKVDLFLFDTKTASHGGSGKTFDWEILKQYTGDVPFFLSGGLDLDNLRQVAEFDHPMLYGVDLNSGFETAPAVKDIDKLERAFSLIKTFGNEIRS